MIKKNTWLLIGLFVLAVVASVLARVFSFSRGVPDALSYALVIFAGASFVVFIRLTVIRSDSFKQFLYRSNGMKTKENATPRFGVGYYVMWMGCALLILVIVVSLLFYIFRG